MYEFVESIEALALSYAEFACAYAAFAWANAGAICGNTLFADVYAALAVAYAPLA
jgi:hypothetical protein